MIYRLLNPQEWHRIPSLPPQSDNVLVLIAEEMGQIKGHVIAQDVVELSHLEVTEEKRGTAVALGLFLGIREILKDRGIEWFRTNASNEKVVEYLDRLGLSLEGVTFTGRTE